MSVILLNDEIVHYEVLGRGKPLLFLHGWVGSWRYWIPSMQVTSTRFRSYALDLWGFGDTAHEPERYALDEQLDLLAGFINSLGIGKVALVGHGLGAVIALMLSQRDPEFVDRVLAAGLPMDGTSLNPRLINGSPKELSDWLLSADPINEAARAEAPKADALALQSSMDGIRSLDIPAMVQDSGTPHLLVYGQNDPAVPPPNEVHHRGLPPEAHIMTFGLSGHFPMLDESNKFNRLVMDFLSLNSGESPRSLNLKEEWKRRVR